MSSERILLHEFTGYTDVGVSQVYRYATGRYCTRSTDTPPDTWYDDRVADPGYIERRLFDDGRSGIRSDGRASVGVGNVRLKNALAPGTEGPFTVYVPDGEQMTIYDASVRYQQEGTPLLVIAGKEYGSGS